MTDCQKATDGSVTSVSTVISWYYASADDEGVWFYYEPGSSNTRYISCSGIEISIYHHPCTLYSICNAIDV